MRRRALFVATPLLAAGLLGALAGSATTGFVRVPRVSELETYRPDIITEIRASDGSTIARYAIERRILVSRAEIPAVVKNAIIATEDKNFYQHGGVDLTRTVSALAADLTHRRYAQGGSTLTQQLARAIFLSPRKTLSRKVNEALVAFEIERRYSKDQILTMYANEIYLGHGNYGFEAASRYYFGKSVKDLTLAEAALLAGIVQRPEDQSPFPQPRARPGAPLDGSAPDAGGGLHHRGPAPGRRRRAAAAFPVAQRRRSSPPTSARRSASTSKTYGEKDLYRRGLRVDSTLDPELQAWSEEALGWGLRRLARRHGFRQAPEPARGGVPRPRVLRRSVLGRGALPEGDTLRGVVTETSPTGAEVQIAGQTYPCAPRVFPGRERRRPTGS